MNTGDNNIAKRRVNADSAAVAVPADYDNDGDMNVLTGDLLFDIDFMAFGIILHRNNGLGQFTRENLELELFTTGRGLLPEDYDQNGDLDVITSIEDNQYWLFLQKPGGPPGFSDFVDLFASDTILISRPTDLDMDGDLDFVFRTPATIEFFENRGGQFSLPTKDAIGREDDGKRIVSTESISARSVNAADYNTDDNPDIAALSPSPDFLSKEIIWCENDEMGNLAERVLANGGGDVGGAGGAVSVFPVDMDVLSGNDDFSTRDVIWYENDGSESFTPHVMIPASMDLHPLKRWSWGWWMLRSRRTPARAMDRLDNRDHYLGWT
jgi:hypothetical protein